MRFAGRGGEGYFTFILTKILFEIPVDSFLNILNSRGWGRLGTTNAAAVEVRGGWADNARVHIL